jgi:hypothetical protein
MVNTFDQKINNAIKNYLQLKGFTATENLLYFYKKLQGGVLTFVIEKAEDKNAEDEHQKFDAFVGLSSFALDAVKLNDYPPFLEGHNPETRVWLSSIKKFNGMALETKSNTDLERFSSRLTENIEFALQEFEGINTTDEILDWLIGKDTHIVQIYEYEGHPTSYHFGMRLYQYLRMNKDVARLDKYIRNSDAIKQRIAENKYTETHVQKIIALANRTTRQIQQDNFTPLTMPESFGKLCDWIDDNNYYKTISGLFEMDDDGKGTLRHWINDEKVAQRFGIFGALPNGDMIGAWLQDDGKMPIVWIGEGATTNIIAANMDDFIALLAIGYYEFWSADITQPVLWENEEQQKAFNNNAFQQFYTTTFNKPILQNGISILENNKSCNELREWLLKNYEPWKEM